MQEPKRHEFDPWVGKSPWGRAWQPTPVFLPGELPWTEQPGGLSSPWGSKESDMTEQLSMAQHSTMEITHSTSFVGREVLRENGSQNEAVYKYKYEGPKALRPLGDIQKRLGLSGR